MESLLLNADKTRYSAKCHWVSVSQESAKHRKLLKDALVCPLFADNNIAHLGIFNAYYPYDVIRVNQSGTFILTTLAGVGEAMIDGNWVKMRKGEVATFPPYMMNAYRAIKGENWEFAWVRYEVPKKKKSIVNASTPTIVPYRSYALKMSIEGLVDELKNAPSSKVVISWTNLIHQQVKKIVAPQKVDKRLINMLKQVAKNLSHDWTLYELAQQANLSEEHLRRLCNQQFGRSPMQQITYLRISYAKSLILNTDESIQEISHKVGYKSQFSFSNTFKKWNGCRPTALRN